MSRRILRPGLIGVRAYRGPVLREAAPDPEGTPTGPPADPTAGDPPSPPADTDSDDDRPMTRREFKAWQAEQVKGKTPEKTPEQAPAPQKKEPEPEPPKRDPEPEEDYPSAWFRPKKSKTPRG